MNRGSPTSAHADATVDREQLRLSALGVNAWIVALVVPALHAGGVGLEQVVVGLGPLAVLAAGAMALQKHVDRARWTLLFGFPASLAAVLAWRSDLAQRDAYGAVGLALAAASLLAFMGAAAHAVGRDRESKRAHAQPLAGKEPVVEPATRRMLRRVLLGAAAFGAFAMTVLAPTLASRRERVRVWGDAADDATTLTAVVATVVAALALGTVIGPALRATRTRRDDPTQRRRRLAASLLIATCAGVGWLLLRHFDGRH